jgi:DNA polymerase III epsilon subunit-like protein
MNAKYLVIDTETTGTNVLKHGLIQLAALAVDKNFKILNTFNQDIKPPENTEITQISLDITGFSLERINNGLDYDQTAQKFTTFIKENFTKKPVVIAQFYPFDYSFMQQLLQNYDLNLLDRNFLDTKSLANIINIVSENQTDKIPFEITSLSKEGGLKDVLNVGKETIAHDALGDCLATLEVLKKLLQKLSVITK